MATRRRASHKKRRRGYHLSAQARANMSKARKGKRHPHKGHPISAATRAKISKALKGRHRGGSGGSSRPGKAKAPKAKRAVPRRLRRTGAVPKPAVRFTSRTSYHRTKVGARRGFFRRTYRVSPRRSRFMTNHGRLRRHSFFRRRR